MFGSIIVLNKFTKLSQCSKQETPNRFACLVAVGIDNVEQLYAREELAAASFVLLTGSSEGSPLVLVEAMAAGCIPIAIDVPYGPADLIRDRVNGFLIPSADAITELRSLTPSRRAAMRRAAQRTARQYSDIAAVRRWSRALRGASKAS